MPRTQTWRDVLPVHPAAELFPMMDEAELRALGEDIKAHGMRSPIVILERDVKPYFMLLDGRNRLAALELVGFDRRELLEAVREWKFEVMMRGKPRFIAEYIADAAMSGRPSAAKRKRDPFDFVISANLHRRHLTTAQRGDLVEKLLRATPGKSDRAIGKLAQVDGKTVAGRRAKLEAGAEIPHLAARSGTDGKKQPATKPPAAAVKVKTRAVRVQVTDERSGKAHIVPFVVPVAPSWHAQAEADPTPPAPAPDARTVNFQLAAAAMQAELNRPRPAATPPDEPEPPHLRDLDGIRQHLGLEGDLGLQNTRFWASTDPQTLAKQIFDKVPLAQFSETIDAMVELLPKGETGEPQLDNSDDSAETAVARVRQSVVDSLHEALDGAVSGLFQVPIFLKEAFEKQCWQLERRFPLGGHQPPISFHDFVHRHYPTGLGSNYKDLGEIIRRSNDDQLLQLWNEEMKAARAVLVG